jgi:hypothetical protein
MHSTRVTVITASGKETFASRNKCKDLASAQKGRWLNDNTFEIFAHDPARDGTVGNRHPVHSGDERTIKLHDGTKITVKDKVFGAPENRVWQLDRGIPIEKASDAA